MDSVPDDAGVLGRLPAELQYLVEPVLRCGCVTEWDAFACLDKATEEQMADYARIADRVLLSGHYPLVTAFLREYPIHQHPECAKLYFFIGVLDHAGLQFDRSPHDGVV